MDSLKQNLKFALRQLIRNPGFTLTVLLTLALSIGANTAIFSLVNALMLKAAPYPHPERLGTIFARVTGPDASDQRSALDGEKWELLRDNVPSLLSAVTGGASGVNLQAGARVQYLQSARISAHYLDVLALKPLLGRSFTDLEDHPHGPKAAILSYGLWRDTFDADPAILGQPILLKGEPHTVIGVLPESALTPLSADLYTALQPSRQGEGEGTNFEVITRLRDGASWQQADAELNRAWSARAQRFASGNPGSHVAYHSVPLQQGETASLRPQLLTLMLAAGFILLIACANLAGLNLVRMLRRIPEVATRLALGASRWQIQRQLWVENIILALLGGAAGVAVGFFALRGLLLLLPVHFLPVADVRLDLHVLAFTLILSLCTSVLFGMLPSLTLRRIDLRYAIATRASAGGDRLRLRQCLIAGEIALTVVLLAASGLLIRTLVHLQTIPPGFNSTGVMTAKASLDDTRYHDPAAFRKLLAQSTAAMRQIPGVQDAAVGLTLPYERPLNSGVVLSDGKEVATNLVYTTPGYFSTLQIPVLLGRTFTDSDTPTSQPVALVNQTFARKFFHGANPIGRSLDKTTVIIGVVADVAVSPGLDASAPLSGEETMYIPATQLDPKLLALAHVWYQPSWIVRTAVPGNAPIPGLTAQMQHALASADPNLPFSGFYAISDLLAQTLATQRIEVALLSALAGLALLLSTVGIFALVANIVAHKTREIGIRLALGSSIRQAMLHTGAPGLRASALGLLAGLLASAAALRVMRGVLYGVQVYDPTTLLAVILTLTAVTLLATALPTLRLASINPATTLRAE